MQSSNEQAGQLSNYFRLRSECFVCSNSSCAEAKDPLIKSEHSGDFDGELS